jgi:hypothetical protein
MLEDRLRAAYAEAAATVAPATVRDLDERTVPGSPRPRRAPRRLTRTLIPVTAALAVAAVATLAVIVPKVLSGPPAAAPAGPRFVVTGFRLSSSALEVHNLATGALTGRIGLPARPGGPSSGSAGAGRADVSAMATGNGRTFIVALYQSAQCRSWLYQFRLDSQGRPSALTPFPALPSIRYVVTGLAVSENGGKIAFMTTGCGTSLGGIPLPQATLGVASTGTGQTRQWAVAGSMLYDAISDLSLTANGGLLAFSDIHRVRRGAELHDPTSYIRVMPTDAAPGNVADRSRIALRPGVVRPSLAGETLFAVISADGTTVYLTTETGFGADTVPGDVRAGDVRTGRLRYLRHGGTILAASPSVRYLLLEFYSVPSPPSPACTSHCPRRPKRPANRFANLPLGQLGRLDLTTGKITYLPWGWLAGSSFFVW